MRIRNFKYIASQSAMTLLVSGLNGCAATISNDGLEQRASAAIGREVGSFTIAKTGKETGGRIDYPVKTQDGLIYQCYMYSVTGFQKAIPFGKTPNSDAICTQMGRASTPSAANSKPKGN